MRIFLAIIIHLIFIGGLSLYMHQREVTKASPIRHQSENKAEFKYCLEIITTFSAEPDTFALLSDEKETAPAVLVRLGNSQLLRITEKTEPGKPIISDSIDGLVIGDNEIFVQASPAVSDFMNPNAMRIKIFSIRSHAGAGERDILADQTFWSENGANVTGIMRFKIIEPAAKESSSHE